MEKESDGCTGIPERWPTWKFEIVDIHWMCVEHDQRCGSHGFYKNTWKARLIGAVLIATVASIACWWKYRKLMKDKV